MSNSPSPVSGGPEFLRLMEGLLDNRLSQEEMREFEVLLNNNPEAIDECARRMKLHAELEEVCDPMHLEFRQDRRMLIEGQGDSRRVLTREVLSAHLGNSRGDTVLGLAGPEARRGWTPLLVAMGLPLLLVLGFGLFWLSQRDGGETPVVSAAEPGTTVRGPVWSRRPTDEADLRFWLENMVVEHGYSLEEVEAATGMDEGEIGEALDRFGIRLGSVREIPRDGAIRITPYPGGRHPRLHALEIAINPQRDTKVSVFTPWAPQEYVVVDLPEALRTEHGYFYLAHTDLPTVWTKMNIHLRPLEWERSGEGELRYERELPDGASFGAGVQTMGEAVRMELWLKNGTLNPMKGITAQVCVLTARVAGFSALPAQNSLMKDGYTATRSAVGNRWIITAWHHLGTQTVRGTYPCMHADPAFGDCGPGETVRARGWLSFYEGDDVEAELARIEGMGWREEE